MPSVASLHAAALHDADALVRGLSIDDLAAATPCDGWDVATLLDHMTGQNLGFAAALTGEPTTADDYAPVGRADWPTSVERLLAAVVDLADEPVLLPEISAERRWEPDVALSFHLLDTCVHTWDLAAAVGQDHRPADDAVEQCLAIARLLPTGEARTAPGASFGPAVELDTDDPWADVLALTGRDPRDVD